jgi:hypothetical protein
MNYDLILGFAKEFKRMCTAHHVCQGCPLQHNKNCISISALNEDTIKTVMKWSKENPKENFVIDRNKLIKDFKYNWGSDLPEEVIDLYNELVTWLENEFKLYGKPVKI